MRSLLRVLGVLLALAPLRASAQPRDVQFDTVEEDQPAAVSCGFCGGEKFGMVFRELPSPTRPGLRASEFPLTLNRIDVGLASVQVACTCEEVVGIVICDECICSGATGASTVETMVEAYAGVTPPTGDISAYPAAGPWPGETMLFGETRALTLSVETTPGTAMFNVTVNQVEISPAVRVDPPNTYIRVVVSIPNGSARHDRCTTQLGFAGPAGVAIRDEGRVGANIGFIRSIGGFDPGWYWNEDCFLGECVSEGDWLIRLNVTPLGSTGTPDAGVSLPDAGTAGDAGTGSPDGGNVLVDAGSTRMDGGTTPMCSMDSQCAGGERCVDGMCQRIACTAASDCAGGMTCVDGMCRNLCDSNAECRGGEVCDMAAGHCVPVMESGGCGCHAAGESRSMPALALLLGALVFIRRSRR